MANQLVSQTEVQLPIGFVYPGIGILSSNQAYNVIIRMSNASSSRTLIQLKDKTSQAKVTNRNPAVTVLREAERREFLKNPNVESNLVDTMLNQLFWLHVKMPERFPFTCIVMLNSTAQGLLHSLIRHYESWCDKSKNLHRMLLTLSDYSVIHADILEISTANADRVTPLLDAFDNVVLPTTWRG
uniref:Trafficking protein particle complex subunit n=1 Tax=Panagrellus redivivus TaxID=6233 RepID=A0A7E4V7J8_PANRE